MNKKPLSSKLLCFFCLIPYFGFIIVLFVGQHNIYLYKRMNKNKNTFHAVLYQILIYIPALIFMGAFGLIYSFVIIGHSDKVVIIWALIGMFITCLCIAVSCVIIYEQFIKKFQKDEQKKLENNLY